MPMRPGERTTAVDRAFAELFEGTSAESSYEITEEVHQAFCALSGDLNPLHVDDTYAQGQGFRGKAMHGGILNAFLSHFVGMVLPGRRSLLLSTDLRYTAPVYLGDVLVIRGTVQQKVESQSAVVLVCTIVNRTEGRLVARGRVQVKVLAGSTTVTHDR